MMIKTLIILKPFIVSLISCAKLCYSGGDNIDPSANLAFGHAVWETSHVLVLGCKMFWFRFCRVFEDLTICDWDSLKFHFAILAFFKKTFICNSSYELAHWFQWVMPESVDNWFNTVKKVKLFFSSNNSGTQMILYDILYRSVQVLETRGRLSPEDSIFRRRTLVRLLSYASGEGTDDLLINPYIFKEGILDRGFMQPTPGFLGEVPRNLVGGIQPDRLSRSFGQLNNNSISELNRSRLLLNLDQ